MNMHGGSHMMDLGCSRGGPRHALLPLPVLSVPSLLESGEKEGQESSSLNCHLHSILVDLFSDSQQCSGELIGISAWGPAVASLVRALQSLAYLLPSALVLQHFATRCRASSPPRQGLWVRLK